jgi:tRNA 2-thiocytidine biosynthesis protein TtcA
MKYIRNILAALRKADRDYSLIDNGDKILVGLSGGKDSLCLLRALSVYGHFAGKKFTVRPVYLDLGFGNPDLSGLKNYCASLGYDLYVSDSRFVYDILKAHTKEGKHIPCSICSRMKKAAMNNIAKDLGFNKVAFAHHNDDAVETLFMNMIHGGRVATFEPKMRLERAGITFIRPLIYCRESDIRSLVKEEGLPVLASSCPANGFTDREKTKEFLQQVYKEWPEARDNFRTLLHNYQGFCLYFGDLEFESEKNHAYAIKPLLSANEMRRSPFAQRPKQEGEEDFLLLHRHHVVGALAYRHLSDHKIALYGLQGSPTALYYGLAELMNRLERETNPLTFVLLGAEPTLRKKLGFTLKKEPGEKSRRWIRKIEL